jgi:hypothetical protein
MIVVPPVQRYASPAALDLGQRLANVVQEYRRTHPGVSDADVRQAYRVALECVGGSGRRTAALLVGLGVAAAFLAVPLVLRGGATRPGAMPLTMLLVFGLIVAVLAVTLVARR